MTVPRELRYTRTHEWARLDGDMLTVGISDFAQQQLSDLTFVELPDVESRVGAGDEVAVVESVKAASDIYAPCDGVITKINDALQKRPELVNQDPYGEGWLFKMKLENPAEFEALLDADQYEELLPGSED
ncbi:MAG: glycine cleavage system protein GcvH [Verrucomicrobia bacterium]|nr:glycine cleavage system protein GcvH [Verrucomicrobiota bacterium]MBU1909939.1 glycine cleavage system protein GcvH [Verrucomicrobiota bacterium]